jgi:hypothetical protein
MGRINAKFLLLFQNDDLKKKDFLCSKTFKISPKQIETFETSCSRFESGNRLL